MTVKTGSVWAGTFVTLDATGALAAGTPSGVLYVNGVANAAEVTISGTNPYKWSVTLPTLTAGQRVDIYITATINEIATAAVVASEQADTGLVSDVQSSMALEATLTAMKGAGWTDETLAALMTAVEAIASLDAAGLRAALGMAAANLDTQLAGVAKTGADGDTLETLSDQMDAVAVAIEAVDDLVDTEVAAILADTNELQTDLTNGGRLDLLIDAIKAKTDNLPTDPADESLLEAAIAAVPALDAAGVRNAVGLAAADLDAQLSAIQADLDNPDQYKANVSSLATSANLAVVDGIVDAIKLKTDNLPSDPADHSILAAAIAALPQGADYTQARAVKLDYLDAAISSRATSGEGTISWTYTLTESDGVTPIQFATVWVTSDISGQDIEASGQTDASGEVTFMLNAGTYYIWRKKRGFRFDNPDTEVVTA